MANICFVDMKIRGEEENVKKFINALKQEGDLYIGRGMCLEIIDTENGITHISGEVKWSMQSALIDNANSMRLQKMAIKYTIDNKDLAPKDAWIHFTHTNFDITTIPDFVDIFEGAKIFNVEFEAISSESDIGFQERLAYINGEVINVSEDDYHDFFIDTDYYKTKEEAEENYGIEITDDEFAEGRVLRETSIGTEGYLYL